MTGDRGLAGPFNGQVLRRAFELERQARSEGQEVIWLAVGRKGASTLRFRRYEVTAQWAGFADKPGYHDAQAVGHKLAELYEAEEVDRVVLIYNRFESALVQRVTTTDLLPIREEVLAGEEPADEAESGGGVSGDFIYEPEPEEILQRLLPVYLETEIYRALLESAAAFLASQMTAMRNASKNAGELIDNLTLSLEPSAAGRDHAGDPRGRGRRGRPHRLSRKRSSRRRGRSPMRAYLALIARTRLVWK